MSPTVGDIKWNSLVICFVPTALAQPTLRAVPVLSPLALPASVPAAAFCLCCPLCCAGEQATEQLLVRGTVPWRDSCSSWGHQKGGNKRPGQGKGIKDHAFRSEQCCQNIVRNHCISRVVREQKAAEDKLSGAAEDHRHYRKNSVQQIGELIFHRRLLDPPYRRHSNKSTTKGRMKHKSASWNKTVFHIQSLCKSLQLTPLSSTQDCSGFWISGNWNGC